VALDEPHRHPALPADAHLRRREAGEGAGDLLGVAKVLGERDRYQIDGRPALPGEHPLPLIGEDVQTAVLPVLERRQHSRPPALREVLRLVDDDGVEPLGLGALTRQGDHLGREELLPVGAVVIRSRRDAPVDVEVVEGADVGRPLPTAQRGDPAAEELGKPAGVAHQRHALTGRGEPSGLLDR
jgi:hypothetical protein